MPVLENVNIALAEVLEVRGNPLQEEELWALIGQSLSAIEDLFLTGRAHKNGVPEYTITPYTLQCTAMGRILICSSSEVEQQVSLYQAPEILASSLAAEDNIDVNEKMEKAYVYSLGKTICYATCYDPNSISNIFLQVTELSTVSSVLSILVETMIDDDITKRLSFPDLVKSCLNSVPLFTNQNPVRKIVIQLHQEVLGSLPEGEILRQVEQDVAKENKEFDIDQFDPIDCDNGDLTSKRQSCAFLHNPVATEFIYGHRFEYMFKDNLVPVEAEFVEKRCDKGPRARWKKAFMKVSERNRQTWMEKTFAMALDGKTSRWENYKAKDSIEKVCEELTERRKMLELLRMNINLAPAINVDVVTSGNLVKGIKPKTLAELVLMLKKPKLTRVKSSSSFGSASCSTFSSTPGSAQGSVHGASPANVTTPTSFRRSTPEKPNLKNCLKHSSDSLRKNVITANLKKNMNSNYYSFNFPELTENKVTERYCWNPSPHSYFGPEFVIRSTFSPLKMSFLTEEKMKNTAPFKVTVILLSGQQLRVTTGANASGRQLFQSIANQIALPEPNLFGLAIRKGDEFLFIDTRQKLGKIKLLLLPNVDRVTFYLRVKFFLPDIDLLNDSSMKHLYYLQVRRNVLEGKTFCSYEKSVLLAGLALQAEFGDYNPKHFGRGDYFLLEHYLPESAIQVGDREDTKMQIFQAHLENANNSTEDVEQEFIRMVMDLPEYGYHFYSVLQDKNDPLSKVWISLSAWGVDVFEDQNSERSMCQTYCWSKIQRISFSKRYFTLIPKSQSLTGKPVKYMFYIGDLLKSSSLFSMAVGHHRYFAKQKSEKNLSSYCSLEELDLIPFSSITNNENNLSDDEDIEYKILPDSINNESQGNPKSWISNFTNKYLEGVKCSGFDSPRKKRSIHKLTKALSASEEEPIDSIRKEYGISVKPLPPTLKSFHSSLKQFARNKSSDNFHLEMGKTPLYDDVYEVLLLRRNLEHGLGLMLTGGSQDLLRGTRVEAVLNDGPCHGKVNQGDHLIAVNGQSVPEKNYLEVVDIIRDIEGEILLTLARKKDDSPSSPSTLDNEMPSLLPGRDGPKSMVNGVTTDQNRNLSLLALDCNGFKSLDSDFDEINNNNQTTTAETCASPPVPARRRRKNYGSKSSLSLDGTGRHEEPHHPDTIHSNGNGSPPPPPSFPVAGGDYGEDLPGGSAPEPRNGSRVLVNGERARDESEVKSGIAEMGIRLPPQQTSSAQTDSFENGLGDGRTHKGQDEMDLSHHPEVNRTNGYPKETDTYEVTLEKVQDSFGFRVAERYQFADGFQRGIFVHSLIPRGAAEFDGNIKPGDQLIKINGTSTEGLSYKEGVALLKKSPSVCALCFRRSLRVFEPDTDAQTPSNESNDMIAKWGRRGSRTSSTSLPGCEQLYEPSSPNVAIRSVSQVALPTVSELRILAENEPSDYVKKEEFATQAVIHHVLSTKTGSDALDCNNYVDISNQAYRDKDDLSNGIVGNGSAFNSSKSSTSLKFNGNGHLIDHYLPKKQSNSPVFEVPREKSSRSSSGSNSSKELLEVVPEDNSLKSFDSVFFCDGPIVRENGSLSVTGSAAKYLAPSPPCQDEFQDNSLRNSVNNKLHCDTTIEYTGCSSGQDSPGIDDDNEPKPVPRRKKKKCGQIEKPQDVYKFVDQSNCFEVSIRKSSRGLGLAIFGGVDMSRLGPICELIRIRKLYPLQPAVACGELCVGDVILEVNGLNMMGLTNTEALETLRVAPNDVTLKIFRPDLSLMPPVTFFIQDLSPASSAMISPTGSASNTLQRPSTLRYSPNVGNTFIDVTLVKQEGTLGFSIFRYEKSCDMDTHPSGIYVKALIREPAISSDQIQAGDRILQVNGEDVSDCTRNDAVNILRNSSDTVTLKLYRAAEPLSPCSLDEIPHSKPLRIEARELLSDKARRRSDGNSASPRRVKERGLRKESVSSSSSAESKSSCDVPLNLPLSISETPSPSVTTSPPESLPLLVEDSSNNPDADIESSDESNMDLSASLNRNSRPKSLDLLCINEKKQNSIRSQAERDEEGDQLFHRQASVVVTNSNDNNNDKKQQIDEKGEGLLKWRGATLLSNEENVAQLTLSLSTLSSGCQSPLSGQSQHGSNGELSSPPIPPRRLTSLQSWDSTPEETEEFLSSGQKMRKLYVQLDRAWQTRIGFSLGDELPPTTNCIAPQISSPVVTIVHPGSLAHKDGRILVGDRLIEVNGESLLEKTATEVIDLLRKTRGKLHLVLLRISKENSSEPLI